MKDNAASNSCPKCGSPIPSDAPRGLCPKCVLAGAATATDAGQPQERPEPPLIQNVRTAFPQLEILELIGQGGMGFVYKARQPNLDRFVALKLMWPKLASQPAFAERFNREARVLARLNHPNIVSVYDFGQAGGFFYLMMEFVDGVNMRQAMKSGGFSPAEALALVPRICDALQFAHEEGILHRDIKPENILLDSRGRLKIADFGIAKLLGQNQGNLTLTETGVAIGTPHYMAPEQLEHPQDVDQRADVYSLGVVFYEMLTGELPVGRFAPPSERATVDPRVDEVVLRALEKQREKRYASAGEVRTRVETIRSTTPVPPPDVSSAKGQPAGPHGIAELNAPPRLSGESVRSQPESAPALTATAPVQRWSKKAIAAALCDLIALIPAVLTVIVMPFAHSATTGAPAVWFSFVKVFLVVGVLFGAPALAGTLLGVASLRDIRRGRGQLRGGVLGLWATLFWPMLVLSLLLLRLLMSLSLPRHVPFVVVGPTALLLLGGVNLLVASAVWRWTTGGRKAGFRLAPAAVAGMLLVLSLPVFAFVALFWIPAAAKFESVAGRPEPIVMGASEKQVSVEVTIPQRQALTVTCTVFSNSIPVPEPALLAKLPPTQKQGKYAVQWQLLRTAEAAQDSAPWEVVVEDKGSGSVAARLRPDNLPELDWKVSAHAENIEMRSSIRESRDFEIARALQPAQDVGGRPADWSIRLGLVSAPVATSQDSRSAGIDAQFTLPAGQVAVFEVVTRQQGTVVPLPDMAAYVIAAPDEQANGTFRCAPVSNENTADPRRWPWRLEITAAGNRSAVGGFSVPESVANYGGQVSLWKALERDAQTLHGANGKDEQHPALGVRIRTLTNPRPLASRHSTVGIGTNWMNAYTPGAGNPD